MRAETADKVEFIRSAVLVKLPKRAIQTKVSRNLRFTCIGPRSIGKNFKTTQIKAAC